MHQQQLEFAQMPARAESTKLWEELWQCTLHKLLISGLLAWPVWEALRRAPSDSNFMPASGPGCAISISANKPTYGRKPFTFRCRFSFVFGGGRGGKERQTVIPSSMYQKKLRTGGVHARLSPGVGCHIAIGNLWGVCSVEQDAGTSCKRFKMTASPILCVCPLSPSGIESGRSGVVKLGPGKGEGWREKDI